MESSMILVRKFMEVCGRKKYCFYNFLYKKEYGPDIVWCHACHRIQYCTWGNRYCSCQLCKCTPEENEGKLVQI